MIDLKRLENWGRWCRSAPSQGRAMSLEGSCRSGDGEDEWYGPTRPRPPSVDPLDAQNIESAVSLLPLKRHVLLKLLFVTRLPGPKILEVMRKEFGERMNSRDLDAAEAMSLTLLEDQLLLPRVQRAERARRIARDILAKYSGSTSEGSLSTSRRG